MDYVLKPYPPERIAAAVDRARERLRGKPGVRPEELAAAARPQGTWLERIVVRDGPRVQIIPVEKLAAAGAQDDYVALRSEGKTYLKSQTLASLAASLDPARFVRVHRSHLIRLEHLDRLEAYAKGSYVAILTDGSRVPVSREGHARLKTLLESEGNSSAWVRLSGPRRFWPRGPSPAPLGPRLPARSIRRRTRGSPGPGG